MASNNADLCHKVKALELVLGADTASFNGLAGAGDLIATALSDQRHNYKCG